MDRQAVTSDHPDTVLGMTFTTNQEDVEICEAGTAGSAQAIFYGENLAACEAQLKDILLESRPPLPTATAPIAAPAGLSDQQRTSIQSKAFEAGASEELPDGWFHDGRHYIDCDGAKSNWHPSMKTWAGAYLVEHNAKAEKERAERALAVGQYEAEAKLLCCISAE